KPQEVMENIFGVTEYLRKIIKQQGGDADRETLNYIKTKTGCNYFEDSQGSPWRCYNYIPKSKCIDIATGTNDLYNSGKAFGNFLRLLNEYPADTLHETILRFHDTKSRFTDFTRAVERDVKGRAVRCASEIDFAIKRKEDCAVLVDMQEKGELPLRVTHNDTKLNNILFDESTGEAMCVIDLDTIMPGLALNDYGDSIRFGASTAAEDEPNLNIVHFDLALFEAYTKGYLEAAGDILTDTEKDYLPWGAKLMTLECGMRFLTDYLQGDTYFKAQRDGQNLDRCRTQFRLVAEMEEHFDEMKKIIKKYR
ncbi:MAG: phosphotransferase, partial [Oscillospiraceae bacterium]